MVIGTSAVKVADAGQTVVLQNLGTGDVYFSYNPTPSASAGGRGLKLTPGASSEIFIASSAVYAIATAASTDLRVEAV